MAFGAVVIIALVASTVPSTRVSVGADLSSRAGAELGPRAEVTPTVSLLGRYAGSVIVKSTYAPRLTLGSELQLLHAGGASLQWAPSSSSVVSVAETFSLGLTDFSYRLHGADSLSQLSRALEPVPSPISAVTSGTDLNFWRELSGSTSLDFGAGYFASGGLDAAAREQLPLQRGPYGSISLTNRVTGVDALTARVEGNASTFSSGRTNRIVRGTGEWNRALSEVTSLILSAGVGGTIRDGEKMAVLPVAGAQLETKLNVFRRLLETGAAVNLAPWTNPLTSVVSNRARALGYLRTDPERKVHLVLAAGAARSVAISDDRAVFAGAQALLRLQPELFLHADVMAQQQVVKTDRSVDRLWTASVGLTYLPGPNGGVNF